MDDSFTTQTVINNEYDYSNILPTIEAISYLIQYCDQMDNWLRKLIDEDEEKNKRFKVEYREYMYKKSYNQQLEICIREKNYNNIICKSYGDFVSLVNNNNLNNISSLNINLCMDFMRGKGESLEKYENSFQITFKPYEIKFIRKANHNDPNMQQLEDSINQIMKQFPAVNTIFCSK